MTSLRLRILVAICLTCLGVALFWWATPANERAPHWITLARGFGLFLIAFVLSSLFEHFFLRRIEQKEIMTDLQRLLGARSEDIGIRRLGTTVPDDPPLEERIRRSKKIWFIGCSLLYPLSYIKPALLEAVRDGAEIIVATLRPGTETMRQLAADVDETGSLLAEIENAHANIRELKASLREAKGTLEHCEHDGLPYYAMTLFDPESRHGEIQVIFNRHGTSGKRRFFIELVRSGDSTLYDMYLESAQRVIKRSRHLSGDPWPEPSST
jgi:hypothetical protein